MALVPDLVPKLVKAGLEVVVQQGAGAAAGLAACAWTRAGRYAAPNPTAADSVRPNISFRCDIEPSLYRGPGPYHSRARLAPPVDTQVADV